MRKKEILKYLILICTMMVSFFIFANEGVNALEYSVNDGKINLEIVPVDEQDLSKGYAIVGASTTCQEGDLNCAKDFAFPSAYVDGYPIVEIKDSDSTVSGVLSNISKVVSGTLYIGDNMNSVGKCAFCNFDYVSDIVVGEHVASIGEYAFAYNDNLKNIVITAYNSGVRSELVDINAFSSSSNLSRIVFKNSTIAKNYKNNVSGWSNVDIEFTFKVEYRFYNDDILVEVIEGYVDEKIGRVPAEISRVGFDFNWIIDNSSKSVVTEDSVVTYSDIGIDGIPYCVAFSSWTLKKGNIYLETSFDGSVKNYTESSNAISVDYLGKNNLLNIKVIASHELLMDEDFTYSYSWSKVISGINYDNYSSLENIRLSRVSDSGTYKCVVTFSYKGQEFVTQIISINVTINPRKLIVNIKDAEIEYGYYLESINDITALTYEIDKSTPLLDDEIIGGFDFNGYYNKSLVGNYFGVLDGQITNVSYQGDSDNNYVSNYQFVYVKGDLKIIPRKLDVVLDDDIVLEYGANENLIKTISLEKYGENEVLSISYVREDISNKNVGEYKIVSANIVENSQINSNFDVSISRYNTGKVVISPKKVNVDWDMEETLVYDGNVKEINASYKTIYNKDIELSVSVKQKGVDSILVNAGKYDLKASMITINKNYELIENTKTIVVEKADSAFIGSLRQAVVYNGTPQRVTVELNHNEGTIVYGDYSTCKNAHFSISETCTINVSVEETANYKAFNQDFFLHINAYEMVVEPVLFEFKYGRAVGQYDLVAKYKGVNNEDVSVYFAKESGSSKLNVGYYNLSSAYLVNNTNYKVSMVNGSGQNKIKINPTPVSIEFFFYTGLVYDGTIKNIEVGVSGTQEDVGLVIDYGNKPIIKNAGDYRIDVRVTNSNFYIEGKDYVEFSVAKANYDVSNLKLFSSKVNFNFKSHYINLQGELPEGLIAIYTIDGKHGNGTYMPFKHTVKVSFSGDYDNYNYVSSLEATLNIDMTWLFVVLALVVFIGLGIPLTFFLLVKYGVIRFNRRIKRSVVRNLIKKNREIDGLYKEFRDKKAATLNQDDEEIIIEDPVKFIKKHVNTVPEELIKMAFVDELFRSSYETKQYYSEVKNELLSYEGIVQKIKRDYETFYLNNVPVAKLDVVDGVLYAYFALDPDQYKEESYHQEKVNSKNKDFGSVPLKLKIDSIDALRHAKMFVRIIRRKEGLKFISNFIRVDYVAVYTAKDDTFKLFKKAFVKRGSKEYFED